MEDANLTAVSTFNVLHHLFIFKFVHLGAGQTARERVDDEGIRSFEAETYF
jgi:hypothetical protein